MLNRGESEMYTLGIDTGGTYTDGVIIDVKDGSVVAKAKSLTTKEDLHIGIANCIKKLTFDRFDEVSMVALSTTLATNAVVEGRGGKVGLILFGDHSTDGELPAAFVKQAKGRFDISGHLKEDIDRKEIRAILEDWRGKVDAVAVSGYASVRNPDHENIAAEMAREILGVQTVCAHQLSSALGFYKRTVTTVLNAKLIPIICELIATTKEVLADNGINAPIMVLKGDGTLMMESTATIRPIETVLSGPAASVIGGSFLTGEKDALILDMGGTTTDIANIDDGVVTIHSEGAKVGGWLTRVRAAMISTYGLGGDSCIWLDPKGKLRVGPQKVWPLCVIGSRYPNLLSEIVGFNRKGDIKTYRENEADCYMLIKEPKEGEVPRELLPVIDALRKEPHSTTFLAYTAGLNFEELDLSELVDAGILARASVTPTDILHVMGRYNEWNEKFSEAGANVLAKKLEIPLPQFLNMAVELITKDLCMTIIQSIADFEGKDFDYNDSPAALNLLNNALFGNKGSLLSVKTNIGKPVIAIGAPVRAWLGPVGEKLGTKIIIPEHAEVANAVGAAAGQVAEHIEVLISQDMLTNEYVINAPWGREPYKTLAEAKCWAVHKARKLAEKTLFDAQCKEYKVVDETTDLWTPISDNGDRAYIGTKVDILGTGKPSWAKN